MVRFPGDWSAPRETVRWYAFYFTITLFHHHADEYESIGQAELEKIPLPERTTDVFPVIMFPVGKVEYTPETAVAVFVVTDSIVPDMTKFEGHTFSAVIVFYHKQRISDLYVFRAVRFYTCVSAVIAQELQVNFSHSASVHYGLHRGPRRRGKARDVERDGHGGSLGLRVRPSV